MITPNPLPPPSNTGVAPTLKDQKRRFQQIHAEAGLDHLRLSGKHDTHEIALESFLNTFPHSERQGRGNQNYRDQYHHDHTGATFWIEQYTVDGGWMIEVNGQACTWLGNTDQILTAFRPLIQNPETNCSRLDLYVDLFGPLDQMIESLTESLNSGLLTPTASHEPVVPLNRDGKRDRHGLNIGSRQSARYLRIYDKGLEAGTEPAGQWIRWEAEFKAEATKAILAQLACSSEPETIQALSRGVIGEITGPGKAFADLVSQSSIRPALDRTDSTVELSLQNYKNRFSTIYEVHRISGMPVQEICSLMGLFEPPENPPAKDSRRIRRAQALLQYIIALSEDT